MASQKLRALSNAGLAKELASALEALAECCKGGACICSELEYDSIAKSVIEVLREAKRRGANVSVYVGRSGATVDVNVASEDAREKSGEELHA